MVAIAPGMEDLQTDLSPLSMHRLGNQPVLGDLRALGQPQGEGGNPPGPVGGHPAGDDQADTTGGASPVKSGHPAKTVVFLFQAGVHRAHQYPVFEHDKT